MDEASAGDALVGLLPPPTIAYLTVVDVVFVSDVNSSPAAKVCVALLVPVLVYCK